MIVQDDRWKKLRNAGGFCCNVLTGLAKNLQEPFDYKKLTEAENSNCSNLYFVMVHNGI